MKKRIFKVSFTLVLLGFLAACSTVAVTNRRQMNLIPNSTMFATSFQQYDGFLKEHKVVTGTSQSEMVKRVGARIQKAVEKYFANRGKSSALAGYKWEFNLVQDKQLNAWCMPGGKVVFYTGIMPVCKNETGIAVVMGHEIAHAIANHGSERMTQQMAVQGLGTVLSTAMRDKPEKTQALWMQAFGVGAQFGVMLPYSRLHESEADEMGLMFMAMAGYNPEEAVTFWTRMSKMGGQKPPEFMSTHPSDATRIRKIKAKLPEALKYYKK